MYLYVRYRQGVKEKHSADNAVNDELVLISKHFSMPLHQADKMTLVQLGSVHTFVSIPHMRRPHSVCFNAWLLVVQTNERN